MSRQADAGLARGANRSRPSEETNLSYEKGGPNEVPRQTLSTAPCSLAAK